MKETSSRPDVANDRVRSWSARVVVVVATSVVSMGLVFFGLGRVAAQQVPQGPGQQGPIPGAPGSEAQPKEEPPTPAEQLIDEAKARLARIGTCSADLEQTVNMLDQRFTIKGNYIKAPGYRVYFRLTLAGLPDTQATSLQVCDGETFWRYQSILDQPFYTKLSIKPVMERINSPDLDPRIREDFQTEMGFAGPESLLAGLRRLFRFEQEKEESKLGEKPVWILRGTWKSRQGLTAGPGRQVPALGMLPPYIPSDAVLYLGKDDGWPYKLTLVGRAPTKVLDTRKEGPDGRKIGSLNSIQSVAPTDITLVYSDVKLNPKVNADDFVFQTPSSAPVEDGTEMVVKRLDQALAAQADRKKDDANKKDGPLLDQPLDVPSPPGQPSIPQPPQ
jgi:outer membrane lipoprotein-sorting protein